MGKKLNSMVWAGVLTSFALFCALPVYSNVGDAFMIGQALKAEQMVKITNKIKKDLSRAALLIGEKGEAAFPAIRKLNKKENAEIFVVDPVSGKILVAPDTEHHEGFTFDKKDINVKIAAEQVRKYSMVVRSQKKGFFSFFTTRDIDLYPGGYAARMVIAPSWKVYMIFTHKSGEDLERHFVKGVVAAACDVIEKEGLKKAMKVFDRANSPFRAQDSYIWLYKTDGTCLYDPLYPEDVGRNVLKMKSISAKDEHYLNSVMDLAKEKSTGWIVYYTRRPGYGSKRYQKQSYFKKIEKDGVDYIVGTGLYLEKTE